MEEVDDCGVRGRSPAAGQPLRPDQFSAVMAPQATPDEGLEFDFNLPPSVGGSCGSTHRWREDFRGLEGLFVQQRDNKPKMVWFLSVHKMFFCFLNARVAFRDPSNWRAAPPAG